MNQSSNRARAAGALAVLAMAGLAVATGGPAGAQSILPDLGQPPAALEPLLESEPLPEAVPLPEPEPLPEAESLPEAEPLPEAPIESTELPAGLPGEAEIEALPGELPPLEAAEPVQPAAPEATGGTAATTEPAPPAPAATNSFPTGTITPGPQDTAASPSEEGEANLPLRLGILSGRDVAQTMASLQPLTRSLSDELGRPVELLAMVSYRAMIDAQALRRIDGGFYSASAYAAAQAQCECLEPLAAPAAEDGTTAYHAIVVARRGSGVDSLDDLKGRTVAAGPANSIAGRRLQLAAMMESGYEIGSFFGRIRTVPSAADAVRLLAAGEVDAAFAWSSLAGDAEEGYSRGTLTVLASTGEIVPGELDVIWQSPALAHGPLAVAKSLPDETKSALRDVMIDFDVDDPDAYDTLSPIYGGGFMAVEPDDYEGAAMLAEQDIDRALLPPATVEGSVPPRAALSEEMRPAQ